MQINQYSSKYTRCGDYQLLGGFYSKFQGSQISTSEFTSNYKLVRLAFKWILIDYNSSSDPNIVIQLQGQTPNNLSLSLNGAVKQQICGLNQEEYIGDFIQDFDIPSGGSFSFTILNQMADILSSDTDKYDKTNRHQYFGIREFQRYYLQKLGIQCSSESIYGCLECDAGYYLNNNTCFQCLPDCLECQNNKQFSICKGARNLNTQNVCVCPSNQYWNGSNCKFCQNSSCDTCNSSDSRNLCQQSCNQFFYSDEYICKLCSKKYLNCQECDFTKCLMCQPNYFLYNGICSIICPEGNFQDTSTGISKCTKCINPSCQTCEAFSSKCLTYSSDQKKKQSEDEKVQPDKLLTKQQKNKAVYSLDKPNSQQLVQQNPNLELQKHEILEEQAQNNNIHKNEFKINQVNQQSQQIQQNKKQSEQQNNSSNQYKENQQQNKIPLLNQVDSYQEGQDLENLALINLKGQQSQGDINNKINLVDENQSDDLFQLFESTPLHSKQKNYLNGIQTYQQDILKIKQEGRQNQFQYHYKEIIKDKQVQTNFQRQENIENNSQNSNYVNKNQINKQIQVNQFDITSIQSIKLQAEQEQKAVYLENEQQLGDNFTFKQFQMQKSQVAKQNFFEEHKIKNQEKDVFADIQVQRSQENVNKNITLINENQLSQQTEENKFDIKSIKQLDQFKIENQKSFQAKQKEKILMETFNEQNQHKQTETNIKKFKHFKSQKKFKIEKQKNFQTKQKEKILMVTFDEQNQHKQTETNIEKFKHFKSQKNNFNTDSLSVNEESQKIRQSKLF
ncbi:hypothetical protein ABPG72_016089 [Tetrahymena utriculariae]